jgi:hypothetical protein
MQKRVCWLWLAAVVSASQAAAAEAPNAMEMFGYTTSRVAGKKCAISINLDQVKFIQSVPQLKAMGVLNADLVDQTMVNTHPETLAVAFLMEMAPLTVKESFDSDGSLQSCSFTDYVIGQDDYGNDRRAAAFSFEFTRAIYGKVNWDRLDTARFPKIAPGFAFVPGFMLQVGAEGASGPQ